MLFSGGGGHRFSSGGKTYHSNIHFRCFSFLPAIVGARTGHAEPGGQSHKLLQSSVVYPIGTGIENLSGSAGGLEREAELFLPLPCQAAEVTPYPRGNSGPDVQKSPSPGRGSLFISQAELWAS